MEVPKIKICDENLLETIVNPKVSDFSKPEIGFYSCKIITLKMKEVSPRDGESFQKEKKTRNVKSSDW